MFGYCLYLRTMRISGTLKLLCIKHHQSEYSASTGWQDFNARGVQDLYVPRRTQDAKLNRCYKRYAPVIVPTTYTTYTVNSRQSKVRVPCYLVSMWSASFAFSTGSNLIFFIIPCTSSSLSSSSARYPTRLFMRGARASGVAVKFSSCALLQS